MADNPTNANEESQAPPAGGGKKKSLIIVGVLMVAEAVAVFGVMKVFNPAPEPVMAAEDDKDLEDPFNLEDAKEIEICEISAFNRKEGRLYVYNVKVSALISKDDEEKLDRFIKAREQSIKDRVQRVFRSADPTDLNDPSLEIIKRQIKFELNNLIGGADLIQEILIPKMLQSRANL